MRIFSEIPSFVKNFEILLKEAVYVIEQATGFKVQAEQHRYRAPAGEYARYCEAEIHLVSKGLDFGHTLIYMTESKEGSVKASLFGAKSGAFASEGFNQITKKLEDAVFARAKKEGVELK